MAILTPGAINVQHCQLVDEPEGAERAHLRERYRVAQASADWRVCPRNETIRENLAGALSLAAILTPAALAASEAAPERPLAMSAFDPLRTLLLLLT